MEEIMVIVCVLLTLSLAVNGLLVWYVRKILPPFTNASDNFADILSRFHAYRTHLEQVYQMEIFYGDETLKGLIRHTLGMIEHLKTFRDVYSFTNPTLDEELEEDMIEEEMEEQENEKPKESRQKKVQKILHQSS